MGRISSGAGRGTWGARPAPDEMAHTDAARQVQCWMVPPGFQVLIAKLVAHGVVLLQGRSSRLRGLSALMGMQPGRERSSPLYAVRPCARAAIVEYLLYSQLTNNSYYVH